jgi:hypothetical protein
MSISEDFKTFLDNIKIDNTTTIWSCRGVGGNLKAA